MITRACACGCGGSLDGRRAGALYVDGRCRVRAHRAQRASTRPGVWAAPDVTVTAGRATASSALEVTS
jgi:hypothetical protein